MNEGGAFICPDPIAAAAGNDRAVAADQLDGVVATADLYVEPAVAQGNRVAAVAEVNGGVAVLAAAAGNDRIVAIAEADRSGVGYRPDEIVAVAPRQGERGNLGEIDRIVADQPSAPVSVAEHDAVTVRGQTDILGH